MSGNYEHIISHPHHVSATRPRMSNYERAAQFSSFKALTGYEDELCETARLVEKKLELTEVQQDDLNHAFQKLSELELPLITVTYFVPDEKKSGGAYVRYTGHFRFLDMAEGRMKFVEGMEILISEISEIIIHDEDNE